jgi:hypothetical protein
MGCCGIGLPERFLKYFFLDRIRIIRGICEGEMPRNFLIEFTRTTPAVITDGPAGLSGSIKMVGFVPRRELIESYAKKAWHRAYVERGRDMREISCILVDELYRIESIDTTLIGGLEMGFKHSWTNINANHKATLLFYTPPDTSYEVRTIVEIHAEDNDPYKKYLNALHDLFHYNGRKANYPAYIFHIKEIYDNSNTPKGFGTKIYP